MSPAGARVGGVDDEEEVLLLVVFCGVVPPDLGGPEESGGGAAGAFGIQTPFSLQTAGLITPFMRIPGDPSGIFSGGDAHGLPSGVVPPDLGGPEESGGGAAEAMCVFCDLFVGWMSVFCDLFAGWMCVCVCTYGFLLFGATLSFCGSGLGRGGRGFCHV